MPNRQNSKGRSKGGHFVMLSHFLLNSPAYLSLTPAARAVYVEIARLFNGRNNGYLALSVRDAAERCRINKDTAAKALVSLQEAGFIECAAQGAFSYKVRHASEWRLTTVRCDKTGALPSKAFMRWSGAAPAKNTVPE